MEDSTRECTGFLIIPKRPYEWYVDAHGCYKFSDADLALGTRGNTTHLPAFLHLRTANFRVLTALRSAIRLGRNAWNVRPPSMSVDNAAEDSPSLQLPNVLVPPLREKHSGVQSPCRDSAQYGIDEADEGDVAQQDHMSAHNLTPSAVTS